MKDKIAVEYLMKLAGILSNEISNSIRGVGLYSSANIAEEKILIKVGLGDGGIPVISIDMNGRTEVDLDILVNLDNEDKSIILEGLSSMIEMYKEFLYSSDREGLNKELPNYSFEEIARMDLNDYLFVGSSN